MLGAFLLVLACGASIAFAQLLTLDLGTLEGKNWKAEGVRVAWAAADGARVEIGRFEGFGHKFDKLRLDCVRFGALRGIWRCDEGVLQGPERLAVNFIYDPGRKSLDLTLATAAGESWQLTQDGDDFTLNLKQAALTRLSPWLPGEIKPSAGRVSGVVRFAPRRLSSDLRIESGAFADSAGLRAGENLTGKLAIDARLDGTTWRWSTRLAWDSGAVLIDPIYVAEGGHLLTATGSLAGDSLEIDSAAIDWRALGRIEVRASIDTGNWSARRWTINAPDLQLVALRPLLPQTWLEQHGLADLVLSGRANFNMAAIETGIERARIRLSGAGVDVPARRLGIEGLDLDFGFQPLITTPFRLEIGKLRFKDLTLGPSTAQGELRDGRLSVAHLIVPLLDGVLALNEIDIGRDAGRWQARLRGALTPLSMQGLTTALDWHPMSGSLSAVLPQMRYVEDDKGSSFSVDGAVLFKVFGGDANVDGIRIDNPFGRTPRLAANLKLRGLDLETMTGAVKFGSISGRVDVNVDGLEMESWQPLSFDARIITSAGDFRKRISQRAVQNISSIGGAGAGAAIQASFMRFFDTFGYERIGLSCRLRNNICEMGGVDGRAGAGGAYTIVKGGGVPALNVVGYNRFVGWQEMLERIQAVIDGNSKMVVQ